MEVLNIVIAEDDPHVLSYLSEILRNMGHTVVAQARSGREAVDKTLALLPDLVIMDIRMEDMDGLEAAEQILDRRSIPIVILTAFSDPDLIAKAEAIGVSGYLVKPCTEHNLRPAIALARSHFQQMQALKQEITDLKEITEARKLIERAKWLLMENEEVSEDEAFRRIYHMSRSKHVRMTKLAEAIIINDRLTRRINGLKAFRQD
jgi:response regulator NasT